jgi:hypothetical protein
METARRLLALGAAAALGAGCASLEQAYQQDASIVPAAAVSAAALWAAQGHSISSEKFITYAGIAAVIYAIFDPLMPNWQVAQAQLAPDRYYLSMRMKRLATGGDGEARVAFNRRAFRIAQEAGYAHYQILAYSEGIESFYPAQRVGEGVIQLLR